MRLHRGLSWLQRAEQEDNDPDASFIFLWIAFNSIYSTPAHDVKPARAIFKEFFNKILILDHDKQLYNMIWTRYSKEIRGLLNNKYIFQPFWENTTDNSAPDWEKSFQKSKEKVHKALKNHASSEILSILIDRLYILRNQLIHGASTWKGKLNREQVRDGERFMRHMVPCLIEIMISNPDEDWGRTFYPALN